MNWRELERINVTVTWNEKENKHKESFCAYDNKGEENASSTYENKEKPQGGYVRIYECGKLPCTSTFECMWSEQEKTISKMKYIVGAYNSEKKEIHSTN